MEKLEASLADIYLKFSAAIFLLIVKLTLQKVHSHTMLKVR